MNGQKNQWVGRKEDLEREGKVCVSVLKTGDGAIYGVSDHCEMQE